MLHEHKQASKLIACKQVDGREKRKEKKRKVANAISKQERERDRRQQFNQLVGSFEYT